MAVQNFYNDGNVSEGTASTHGDNTIIHYYDKAGVKAANAVAVYAQFGDRRSMPLKMGKTYKVSKWLHIFDRNSDFDGGAADADFETRGYLTARSLGDIHDGFQDGNGVALAEGDGIVNQKSIQKVTIETNFARYGEMIDFTDEVDMFSEDMVQVQYREELGLLANRRSEDLIQLDMLESTNEMYSGTASSLATVGVDVAAVDNTDDDEVRVSYDLIRRAVRRLVRNRAMKNTSLVTGSTKIDTRTVNKAFYAIIGPEVKFDLENLTRGTAGESEREFVYIPVHKYGDAANLAEGEVGCMNEVRFIESESALVYRGAGDEIPVGYAGDLATFTHAGGSHLKLNAATGGTYAEGEDRFDVFPILFPTKGSFATVGLKGHGKIKFNSQAPTKIELANPYGTQGFFSYNFWHAGIILREERLLKVLVCATE